MVEALIQRSALAEQVKPAASEGAAGVRVRELTGLGLASVLVRNGRRAELAAKIAGYGAALPDGPESAADDGLALLGTGPRAWLAVKTGATPLWPEQFRHDLEGLASVADQSSAYTVLHLEGPSVRRLLAKGVMLDLYPRAFAVGAVAGISIAHAGAILWRSGEDHFDLFVARSYAADVWRWLDHSAAEFGLAVGAEANG
ncbi:MAG: sarcosine oxidase subunit gamma family protein [Caulobacteraceae bacterium]